MTNFASLLLADGAVIIAPAEPASLQLMLIGLGTLAAFATLGGFRLKRRPLALPVAKRQADQKSQPHRRRAA